MFIIYEIKYMLKFSSIFDLLIFELLTILIDSYNLVRD